MEGDYRLGSDLESEPPTLSFGSHQDALDYASNVVEDANRRFVAHSLDFCERYRYGELDIVVKLVSHRGMGERDLIFHAVPMGWMQDSDRPRAALDIEATGDDAKWSQKSVLVGVAQLVQGPQRIIPSFVWLEAAKERQDFLRKMLGAAASYCVVESGGIVSKGKVGGLGIGVAGSNGGSIASLIENRAKCFDGLGCRVKRSNGNWALEADSMHQGINIYLGNAFVGVFCMPGYQALFQTPNVLLSPSQSAFRAVERMAAGSCHEREI